jgi:hypothetical protein
MFQAEAIFRLVSCAWGNWPFFGPTYTTLISRTCDNPVYTLPGEEALGPPQSHAPGEYFVQCSIINQCLLRLKKHPLGHFYSPIMAQLQILRSKDTTFLNPVSACPNLKFASINKDCPELEMQLRHPIRTGSVKQLWHWTHTVSYINPSQRFKDLTLSPHDMKCTWSNTHVFALWEPASEDEDDEPNLESPSFEDSVVWRFPNWVQNGTTHLSIDILLLICWGSTTDHQLDETILPGIPQSLMWDSSGQPVPALSVSNSACGFVFPYTFTGG